MRQLISIVAIVAILGLCFTSCKSKKSKYRKPRRSTVVEKDTLQPDTVAYEAAIEPVVEPVVEVEPVAEPVVQAERMKYFMIAGSYQNMCNAEIMQAKLQELGYDSRIFDSKEGNHRVSYMSFSNLKEAFRVLADERSKEGSEDVWLHIPRRY